VKTTQSTISASPTRRLQWPWRRNQFVAVLRDALNFLLVSWTTARNDNAFKKWQGVVAALQNEIFERPCLRHHCALYASHLNVKLEPTVTVAG
jgi:hypothetical protein